MKKHLLLVIIPFCLFFSACKTTKTTVTEKVDSVSHVNMSLAIDKKNDIELTQQSKAEEKLLLDRDITIIHLADSTYRYPVNDIISGKANVAISKIERITSKVRKDSKAVSNTNIKDESRLKSDEKKDEKTKLKTKNKAIETQSFWDKLVPGLLLGLVLIIILFTFGRR